LEQFKFLQECPDVALEAVVGLCKNLTAHNRSEVVRTLAQLEFENANIEGGSGGGHSSI
jgi:hypothetical protein